MAETGTLAKVTQVRDLGMIMIRADLARAGDAIAGAAGLPIPDTARVTGDGARGLGWMSPDELLMVLPVAEVGQTVRDLADALTGEHAMVQDVSNMRCVFDVTGRKASQVLSKLCPVDFAALPADGLRRTRAAQVACGIWRVPDGFRVIAFRSVTDYLRGILENAAQAGTGLDPR